MINSVIAGLFLLHLELSYLLLMRQPLLCPNRKTYSSLRLLSLVLPFPLHQVPVRFSPAPDTDLVYEMPLALVLPFPLHQVSEWISPAPDADLVHEMPLALVLPFPLHQVLVRISPAPGANLVLNLKKCLLL